MQEEKKTLNKEVNKLTIEEYYIRLLTSYGQDGEVYRKLGWKDEQELPLELTTYIYSDDFLEMLNQDITDWQDELISNIKNSTAYAVLKEKIQKGVTSDTLYGLLNEINNCIVEVYEYQRQQNKKYNALKKNATLLIEGTDESDDMSLNEVNRHLEELSVSYRSLHTQLQEVRQMKKKLVNRIKRSFYRIGVLEEDHREEVLEEQIQVIEGKMIAYEKIKAELELRYAAIEEALKIVQKEILAPQIIGELTNIQQQLLLTNDAILRQIARPLLRKIQQTCGIVMPKGLYRFKLYIELRILYSFHGPILDNDLKNIELDVKQQQKMAHNEFMLLQSI